MFPSGAGADGARHRFYTGIPRAIRNLIHNRLWLSTVGYQLSTSLCRECEPTEAGAHSLDALLLAFLALFVVEVERVDEFAERRKPLLVGNLRLALLDRRLFDRRTLFFFG